MITLHLLQLLKDNGFGTAIDEDLFFEKLPLGKNGIAIFSRGGESAYGRRTSAQRFDLYSRGDSDLSGYNNLENIKTFFQDSYAELCTLPSVPSMSNRQYQKARITVIDNVENVGLDENDRVIYRLGATIIYQKVTIVS
jgi:hypothetical protein